MNCRADGMCVVVEVGDAAVGEFGGREEVFELEGGLLEKGDMCGLEASASTSDASNGAGHVVESFVAELAPSAETFLQSGEAVDELLVLGPPSELDSALPTVLLFSFSRQLF